MSTIGHSPGRERCGEGGTPSLHQRDERTCELTQSADRADVGGYELLPPPPGRDDLIPAFHGLRFVPPALADPWLQPVAPLGPRLWTEVHGFRDARSSIAPRAATTRGLFGAKARRGLNFVPPALADSTPTGWGEEDAMEELVRVKRGRR